MSSPSSPDTSKRFPAWFLLLAAIGVPSAAGLTFAQTITEHPWQALIIALLYEGGVLLVSMVTGVWQQLQNNWVKQIADWIDNRIQEVVFGYQRHYRRGLIYEHRYFDVKGLSTQGTSTLSLEQVFVELSIVPKAPHLASTDLLSVPEVLRTGQHSIWDYLSTKTLTEQHLVIIGAPGSGKTTLLQHMSLRLLEQKRSKIAYRLPFFLFLRDYAKVLQENSAFSLADAVQLQANKWERVPAAGWVERQLMKGHNLILLDGLDEVADPETRRRVADWVEQQMLRYGNNRFVVTSRPFGYLSNPLNGVTVLEVQAFTYEQIERFIHNWYLANEIMSTHQDDAGVRMDAKNGANDLLRRLRSTPTLLKLAVNPLLLTMIATVHRYRATLPDKRVALYEEICEVFLGKRQEVRGLKSELSPAQKQWVLQPLAYQMMVQGKREIELAEAVSYIEEPLVRVNAPMEAKAFLQMVENSSGLLLEREIGTYGFGHLTFQEYLTAMHIRENKLEQILVEQVGKSWWHETTLLYCARADATAIVGACVVASATSIPALKLALELQEEAFQVHPAMRSELDEVIAQGVEDRDDEKRQIVSEALLSQRIDRMIPLNEKTYVDISLISCAEYQLFLAEQQQNGKYYQPDHWAEYSFPAGLGRAAVLGIRPSDALVFCSWLTERETGGWRYRLVSPGELQQVEESTNSVSKLEKGTGYWTKEGQEFIWGKGSSVDAERTVRELLEDVFAQDRQQILEFVPDAEDASQNDLAQRIEGVHDLVNVRKLTDQLLRALHTTRELLRAHGYALQDTLTSISKNLTNLRNKQVDIEQALVTFDEEYSKIDTSMATLNGQLAIVLGQEYFYERGGRRFSIARNEEEKIDVTEAELFRIREHKERLENAIEEYRKQMHVLKTRYLEKTRERDKVEGEIEHTQRDKNIQQTALKKFREQTEFFLRMCDRLLPFTLNYDRDALFLQALTRNATLDFNNVIGSMNSSKLDEILHHISGLSKGFIHGLTRAYEAGQECSKLLNAGSVSPDNGLSELIPQMDGISLDERVQEVDTILRNYLKHLAQRRPLGRDRPMANLMRLVIRYFARELTDHLTYWSWQELLAPLDEATNESGEMGEKNLSILNVYLDILVSFAILEERTEGRLAACEGLLIARER